MSVRETLYAAAGASQEPLGGGGRYGELLTRLAERPPQLATELHAVMGEALCRARTLHWEDAEVRQPGRPSAGWALGTPTTSAR